MAAAAKGGRACGVVVVIVSVVTALAGCGTPVSRFLAGSSSAASTTTTAIFQATGPLSVSVSPAEGPAGTAFHLRVTGLVASDVATFSIAATGGHPYTGPKHVPGPDGSVSAVYETSASDPAGLYVVLAHTASGRGAFASFRVDAAAR